jgi:hypothetical protein
VNDAVQVTGRDPNIRRTRVQRFGVDANDISQ